jgi:hypothetical protein
MNTERFADQRIMRGVLIEDQSGPVIPEDIAEEIAGCSIYVGIFGRRKSDWTFREYREARARDLPLLVYQVTRRGRLSARTPGRRTEVQKFLDQEARPRGIRIRTCSKDELEDIVVVDVAIEAAKLVNEAARVRKTIHKGLVL